MVPACHSLHRRDPEPQYTSCLPEEHPRGLVFRYNVTSTGDFIEVVYAYSFVGSDVLRDSTKRRPREYMPVALFEKLRRAGALRMLHEYNLQRGADKTRIPPEKPTFRLSE